MKKKYYELLVEIDNLFMATASTVHLNEWLVIDIGILILKYWVSFILVKDRVWITSRFLQLCQVICIEVESK